VIGLELGRALDRARRARGLQWQPRPGDHFVVPDRDLDDTVFVVSDMVVEVVQTATGPVLAFNGTTEWALDSVEIDEVVWLPLEHQLREQVGDDLVGLTVVDPPVLEPDPGSDAAPRGYAVTVRRGAQERRYLDVSPEAAYARAVLDRLDGLDRLD
jgi:hypothetical protein